MILSLLMWIVFSITVAYLIVIGVITYGWFALFKTPVNNSIDKEVHVSVVIAVRNESSNIQKLLKQIINQDYNSSLFEIIIINDHSTDNTLKLINEFKANNLQIKIIIIEAKGSGKKNALSEGISISSGELILSTDGDCNVKPEWVKSVVDYYLATNKKVILGPVIYNNEKTYLQKLFSLDFISLVASGAGAVGVGLPLMGNGANLAFTRDVYFATKGEGNSEKYASGDDVFLIHNVSKKYGADAIGFLQNSNAIVSTNPPSNFSQFFKQRIRWASKASGYQLVWPILVAITVFLFNMSLFVILVGSLWFNWLLPVYFLIIITKFLIDTPLIFSFLSFAKKTSLKPLFLVMEFVYPPYIVLAAIASSIFSFDWKGRENLK